jgi:hypothetical protein
MDNVTMHDEKNEYSLAKYFHGETLYEPFRRKFIYIETSAIKC